MSCNDHFIVGLLIGVLCGFLPPMIALLWMRDNKPSGAKE